MHLSSVYKVIHPLIQKSSQLFLLVGNFHEPKDLSLFYKAIAFFVISTKISPNKKKKSHKIRERMTPPKEAGHIISKYLHGIWKVHSSLFLKVHCRDFRKSLSTISEPPPQAMALGT
jgi:hypothetical protein